MEPKRPLQPTQRDILLLAIAQTLVVVLDADPESQIIGSPVAEIKGRLSTLFVGALHVMNADEDPGAISLTAAAALHQQQERGTNAC